MNKEPLAIIGIGCRFPGGGNSPETFWKMLCAGTDAIAEIPADRWNIDSFYDPDPDKAAKTNTRWGGFIEGIDLFDANFFGISPREASQMDPQQRLLLETAFEAMEDGGQPLERWSGKDVAVYMGLSSFDYSTMQTDYRDRGYIDVYSNTGTALSIAANRISYCFNFKGPSAVIDTACSSSLVALHLACQSLWSQESALALAGGANVLICPNAYIGFSKLSMMSPDGRCRAFDARGNGFVRSDAVGVVVLKPLSRARADGERIYALIRATAVNQDGRTVGMTVPSQSAQEMLLRKACREAGIDPAQVQYVEAHGTGTPVGDPIEARALGAVLGEGRPAGKACLIGSVKSNIGHPESAAGIAGLIKTALALHHRQVPASLHCQTPNPDIPFEALGLRVPQSLEPWPDAAGPALEPLAGVNSFGFGGTNAHAILQGPPEEIADCRLQIADCSDQQAAIPYYLVPLSARSPEALQELSASCKDFVGNDKSAICNLQSAIFLRDLVHTVSLRRSHHNHRLAVVACSAAELAEQLGLFLAGESSASIVNDCVSSERDGKLAFVFCGQGPQWWGMGRQLLAQEPVFRATIERVDRLLKEVVGWSVLEELSADESHARLEETAIAQPAIFAVQVALVELWRSWGIRPTAVVGHSVGEVAAAYTAGALTLEDAVCVIGHRGRCMELAPAKGGMLAVGMSLDEWHAFAGPLQARGLRQDHRESMPPLQFNGLVAVAAINGPASLTLSGPNQALAKIARQLDRRQVFQRLLRVNYAFHSPGLEPVRDELLQSLRDIEPRPASLTMYSTVTGQRLDGPELDADYWWHNLRQPVRFADAVERLIVDRHRVMVEVGPHPVLGTSIRQCFSSRKRQDAAATVKIVPSLRRQEQEGATMRQGLGALYVHGYPVAWDKVAPPGRFIALPAYPWQRQSYWHEGEGPRRTRIGQPDHPLLGQPQGTPQPSWEAKLERRLLPWLDDHRVKGQVVFPAAGYLEMALAAAGKIQLTAAHVLEEVKFLKAFFLAEGQSAGVQTVFHAEEGTFHIYGRHPGASSWTLHAQGRVRSRPSASPAPPLNLSEIWDRCPVEAAKDDCYRQFHERGLDYGPSFQGIDQLWRGNGECLARIEVPELVKGLSAAGSLHPATVDAGIQVMLGTMSTPANWSVAGSGQEVYLPVEIAEVRVHGWSGEPLWSHARLVEKGRAHMVADVQVFEESGRLVWEARGLRCQAIRLQGDSAGDDLLYESRWEPEAPARATEARAGASGSQPGWLLFADRDGIADRLARLLESQGHRCVMVHAGARFQRCGPGRYELSPATRDELALLWTELAAQSFSCSGIVHLWSLDAPAGEMLTAEAIQDAQEAGCLSVVSLVQAWGDSLDNGTRLVLVTRRAQAVGNAAEPVAPAQATLWGLARVIANEAPRLRCRLVDLGGDDGDAEVQALFEELCADTPEDEIALRGGARYVHRYARTTLDRCCTGPIKQEEAAAGSFRLEVSPSATLEELLLRAAPRRAPAAGEVEVEVFAAGLNFSDVMKALGLLPGLPEGPVPLGLECSGTISAVGDKVEDLRAGDEVLALTPFSFSKYVCVPARLVARKPAHLSFDEAAAIPVAFLTAYYALHQQGRMEAGASVLIHSATGGVGLAAVQLARAAGARIFATAGTPEKRAFLHSLGIEHVMDSRSLDFADQVMKITGGRGVDLILNSLAGEAIAKGMSVLADYGRFLEIGKSDIYKNSKLGMFPFRKNVSFIAIDLDRSIRERRAQVAAQFHEVIDLFRQEKLAPLPHRVFPLANVQDAFRLMAQGKHIGKVVLSFRGAVPDLAPASEPPPLVRADGAYLITGGLGGFGLVTARWLVEQGGRHLVLMGRSGAATPEAHQAVLDLQEAGAQVHVAQGDIACREDLARVLSEVEQSMPPLRGVIHAAMVLDDCLLSNLTPERWQRVLGPKAIGAWNLHCLTRELPLDFFICFSSMSAIFGVAGQANYCAANAFLDALAHHRRACGLPGMSINWGYLGEVGYLARYEHLGQRFESWGARRVSPRHGLDLMGRLLHSQAVQAGIMAVDWDRWHPPGASNAVPCRFQELCSAAHGKEDGLAADGVPLRTRLLNLDGPECRQLLESVLRDRVARALGAAPSRLDVAKPIQGLDSLVGVELRNWMEGELHIHVPIVTLTQGPSIVQLTDMLLQQLAGKRQGAAASAPESMVVRQEPGSNGPVAVDAKELELSATLDSFK